MQQEIVNRVGLIEDFVKHPAQGPALLNEFFGLVDKAVNAHSTPFLAPNDYLFGSVDDGHDAYLQSFAAALGDSDPSALHALDFWSSAFSAALLGNLAPFIGMELRFFDDVSGIVESISGGHLADAFQTLTATPVNVVNALLNGYGTVDLPDIPLSDLFKGLESNTVVTSINLGGIFSPSGSLFESLGLTATACRTSTVNRSAPWGHWSPCKRASRWLWAGAARETRSTRCSASEYSHAPALSTGRACLE